MLVVTLWAGFLEQRDDHLLFHLKNIFNSGLWMKKKRGMENFSKETVQLNFRRGKVATKHAILPCEELAALMNEAQVAQLLRTGCNSFLP